jgi:putative flippase GtrA
MPVDVRQRLNRRGGWAVECGRAFRFGLIGAAATLTYLAVSLGGGEFLGLAPLLASSIGVIASFCVSYAGHRAFSFRVAPEHRIYLPRFLAAAGVIYVVQLAVMAAVTDLLRLPYQTGVAAIVAVIPLVTFLINRLWVFASGLRPPP